MKVYHRAKDGTVTEIDLDSAEGRTRQRLFGESEREIAIEEVTFQGRCFMVSTVFLPINHRFFGMPSGPPLLFESMIFERHPDGTLDYAGVGQQRYATEAEARDGHKAIVRRIQEGLQEIGAPKRLRTDVGGALEPDGIE
jgi:hypothetical protein